MPLGNGEIGACVYAIEDDALYLLFSRNDSFDQRGELLKTGRVKVELSPNPFAKGKAFRQVLDMKTGSLTIEADGVALRIWADANNPVCHVQIESPSAITVTADVDPWTRTYKVQDTVVKQDGYIASFYAVGDESVFETDMKFYGVGHLIPERRDPFRFNTFGNLLKSDQLELKDGKLVGTGRSFDLQVFSQCEPMKDSGAWLKKLVSRSSRAIDLVHDWNAHCAWWRSFWDRSWIVINNNTIPELDKNQIDHEGYKRHREFKDDGALVAQSYNFFRFLMACQGRGTVQAKFNGGIFTQQQRFDVKDFQGRKLRLPSAGEWLIQDKLFLSHEDYRAWGRRYTFQNQRLLYWPLFMSGDFDLQKPFFDYYWDMLPVRVAINKAWFGHDGAYFRENIDLFGCEMDCMTNKVPEFTKPLKVPPGGNKGQGNHHSFYFTSGLETVAMMIEYVQTTGDTRFRDEKLVPFAREILTFYDQHYSRDANGKLRLDPSQVLETWWIAVNPTPDVAGLLHNLDALLRMGVGTEKDKANWQRLRAEVPDISLRKIKGKMAIAPGEQFSFEHNAENGELYSVFPFRRFGLGLGTEDLVLWTMENRTAVDAFERRCWTQDQIDWAYAGHAGEAQEGLVARFRACSPIARFPIYGDSPPDEIPDMDHFGSGAIALQRMLVQRVDPLTASEKSKILLLPAWPANWDVSFKLHVDFQTTVEGVVRDGRLVSWSISPETRKPDVVVFEPQK